LTSVNLIWFIIIALVCAIITGIVAFLGGIAHRKKEAEFTIGSAEQEAKRIISDAIKSSEAKKKEAVLEGKDEIHRLRNESERELNDRRKEVQRQERRIQQKEEILDKKMESLEAKDEILNNKNKLAEERLAEAEAVRKSQFDMLERISGFTVEQAKEYMLKNLEDELTHEKAVKLMEFEQQTREDADKMELIDKDIVHTCSKLTRSAVLPTT
jgi:ribonuclease Y